MLQLIGAGFGRTGTASMKAALEHLGYGPTYHMLEIIAQPQRAAAWTRAAQGETLDWRQIFDGYRSTVDWPGAAYWRELTEAFPEAKVLLTVRDPERWYDSTYNTLYQFALAAPGFDFADKPMAGFKPAIDRMLWKGIFGGRFEDKDHAIRVFEAHNAAVQQAVPADRLLVHRTGDGWEPLCDFLGVDVPAEDFPHVNDTGSIRDLVARTSAEGKAPSAFG